MLNALAEGPPVAQEAVVRRYVGGVPERAPHRKQVRHDERVLQARLLTFSCFRRWAMLLEGPRPGIVAEALERAAIGKRWVLLAWVFMPEHVHLLAVPWHGASDVSGLLSAVKRPSSFRIKQQLAAEGDPLLDKLAVRERPGDWEWSSARQWEDGVARVPRVVRWSPNAGLL